MRRERFEKRLAKLGLEAQEGYNGKWFIHLNGEVGSWRYEDAWGEVDGNYQRLEGVQEARSFHIRRENDHSDSMTDYFAGYFLDNASQFFNTFCPPPPKYPVGALVRGKDNKRANRNGYAGKTGLVMETSNTNVKVHWLGEQYPPRYNYGYPQRDLELVAAAA